MPNRVAKQLRNSPQLSNLLDGDGEGLLEMEGQQKRVTQDIEKEHRIRETAGTVSGPTEQKAFKPRERNLNLKERGKSEGKQLTSQKL